MRCHPLELRQFRRHSDISTKSLILTWIFSFENTKCVVSHLTLLIVLHPDNVFSSLWECASANIAVKKTNHSYDSRINMRKSSNGRPYVQHGSKRCIPQTNRLGQKCISSVMSKLLINYSQSSSLILRMSPIREESNVVPVSASSKSNQWIDFGFEFESSAWRR